MQRGKVEQERMIRSGGERVSEVEGEKRREVEEREAEYKKRIRKVEDESRWSGGEERREVEDEREAVDKRINGSGRREGSSR